MGSDVKRLLDRKQLQQLQLTLFGNHFGHGSRLDDAVTWSGYVRIRLDKTNATHVILATLRVQGLMFVSASWRVYHVPLQCRSCSSGSIYFMNIRSPFDTPTFVTGTALIWPALLLARPLFTWHAVHLLCAWDHAISSCVLHSWPAGELYNQGK